MAFMKTNSVDITVDGHTYNSLTDFGLAIENTDYIGKPVRNKTGLVYVPGVPRPLDTDSVVFGGPWFMYRTIDIAFGGLNAPEEWDSIISTMRNLFEGKIVKLTFITQPEWYWRGVASIEKFDRKRTLGTFDFCLMEADAYQYHDETLSLASGRSYSVTLTGNNVIPSFDLGSATRITINYESKSYQIAKPATMNTDLRLHSGANTFSVSISGTGPVIMSYSDRSL